MTTQTEISTAAQAIIDAGMAVEADVLLAAITQREQILKSERIDIAEWFEQAKADEIAGLKKQISDTEACLANWQERWRKDTEELALYLAALEAGRKERPEVDRIRNDRASSDPQQGHPGWQYAYNSQGTLLSAIDELHLTEAALRVACDHKQEVIEGMQVVLNERTAEVAALRDLVTRGYAVMVEYANEWAPVTEWLVDADAIVALAQPQPTDPAQSAETEIDESKCLLNPDAGQQPRCDQWPACIFCGPQGETL